MKRRTTAVLTVAIGIMLNVVLPVSARETGIEASAASEREKSVEGSKQLVDRGRQLRLDIDRTYKKLSEEGAIKNQGMGRNFITDVVTKYIPLGTSFDDAEAILRAAGFTVYPRIPNPRISDLYPEKHDVIATIDQYVPTPFGKTSVDVALRPRAPGDYSVVQNVTAEITRIFP